MLYISTFIIYYVARFWKINSIKSHFINQICFFTLKKQIDKTQVHGIYKREKYYNTRENFQTRLFQRDAIVHEICCTWTFSRACGLLPSSPMLFRLPRSFLGFRISSLQYLRRYGAKGNFPACSGYDRSMHSSLTQYRNSALRGIGVA